MAATVRVVSLPNIREEGTAIVRAMLQTYANNVFAVRLMAANLEVQAHTLENFLAGQPLPVPVMHGLVKLLFHGQAAWDEKTDLLVAVYTEPAPMPDMHDQATAVNLPA
jgi:hypothetical protein